MDAIGGVDLGRLAEELRQLRPEISRIADTPAQDTALLNLAKAETAVADQDVSKAAEFLKKAGAWVLDVATKIGTSVAAAAISNALQLK
jgi:hypothetical protein